MECSFFREVASAHGSDTPSRAGYRNLPTLEEDLARSSVVGGRSSRCRSRIGPGRNRSRHRCRPHRIGRRSMPGPRPTWGRRFPRPTAITKRSSLCPTRVPSRVGMEDPNCIVACWRRVYGGTQSQTALRLMRLWTEWEQATSSDYSVPPSFSSSGRLAREVILFRQ
jgi:hypothetical protein